MKEYDNCTVSELQEKWLDDTNCLIGFTVTFENGDSENRLMRCNHKTHDKAMQELIKIRNKYLGKVRKNTKKEMK
jgi:hypothetical protein